MSLLSSMIFGLDTEDRRIQQIGIHYHKCCLAGSEEDILIMYSTIAFFGEICFQTMMVKNRKNFGQY